MKQLKQTSLTAGAAGIILATIITSPAARAQTQLITNGGFETGTFAGWTRTTNKFSQNTPAGFFIEDNTLSDSVVGQTAQGNNIVLSSPTSPINELPTVGSRTGNFYAVTDSDGGADCTLSQNFTVPQNASRVTLSFALFVNARNGAGALNTAGSLTYTQTAATQYARVDLFSITSGGPSIVVAPSASLTSNVVATSGALLANFYLGADATVGPNPLYPIPYSMYSRDITALVTPGRTYQIRFAEVSNQYIVNTGVDDVSVLATTSSAAPEPASVALALFGLAAGVARRRSASRKASL